MSDNSNDPIIDACLDEVLGGQTPPNLTSRILHAWNVAENEVAGGSSSDSLATHAGASPTAETTTAVRVRAPKRVALSRRQTSPWLALASCLAIIGVGAALVGIVWNATELRSQREQQVAAPAAPFRPSPVTPDPQPRATAQAPSEPLSQPLGPAPKPARERNNSLAIDLAPSPRDEEPIPEVNVPDDRPAPLTDDQIVLAINELIRNGWQSEGILPAKPVSDEQWCERVYLKLIGRSPAPQEVSSFVESRSVEKRKELVDLLLQGETYVEEFASHWSKTWSDILIASGDKKNSNRDGLAQYLRRAFGEGEPFDETTSALLTATGSGQIGAAGYNGATNFLVAHADRKGVYADATAHVSRTFLGLALECSQCHVDSTWSGIEQERFWELNAFFRQLVLKRDRERGVLIADADIRPRGPRSTDGETYYPLLDGKIRAAYPVFVDGTEIPRHPSVEKVNRRDLLAKLITRSEQFRQAIANRFWAELFGVGFTIPADNIGPHNPPSHPELLAKLGGQFAAHDYDIRALVRWIVLSEPFALSSGDVAVHDQIGASLAFDRFPEAKDNREPVLTQLRVAQGAYASFVNKSANGATSARVKTTPNPGAVPTELSDVDKLLATVAPEARRLSKATVYGNYILESNMRLEQKIQHMFFATLHRAPTAREQKAVADVLASSGTASGETALQFIWWALASSEEAR